MQDMTYVAVLSNVKHPHKRQVVYVKISFAFHNKIHDLLSAAHSQQ